MDGMFEKYAGMAMPAQGRVALQNAAQLINGLIGCSGNTMPTDGQGQGQEIYPSGTDVCYALNGAKYKLKLLEPLTEGMRSVRAEDANGKFTMANAEWISDLQPGCREAFPEDKGATAEFEGEDDDMEDEEED
jgi:hypothetical protein